MVRWEPGARERLQAAALELYAGQGYERTTAAEIARAAGVTERTFFRHFADKREVLFDGQEVFQRVFLDAIAASPEGTPPFRAVEAALDGAAGFFDDARRAHSRHRQTVLDATPALKERELLKLAALAAAMAEALTARGAEPGEALLAAESGMAVFSTAFARWIAESEERSMAEVQGEVLAGLRAMVGM